MIVKYFSFKLLFYILNPQHWCLQSSYIHLFFPSFLHCSNFPKGHIWQSWRGNIARISSGWLCLLAPLHSFVVLAQIVILTTPVSLHPNRPSHAWGVYPVPTTPGKFTVCYVEVTTTYPRSCLSPTTTRGFCSCISGRNASR